MKKSVKYSLSLVLAAFLAACGGEDSNSENQELITHNGVTYGTVTSPITGRVWLDRNLGASRVCTAVDDTACYGDYYQWGRHADGHEEMNSSTTTTVASSITPAHSSFITSFSNENEYDWTTDDVDGSLRSFEWSKVDGTSICPVGYRVPTFDELEAEKSSLEVSNSIDPMHSFLKLPLGEDRGPGGTFNDVDQSGHLSSTTVHDTYVGMYSFYYTLERAGSDGLQRGWGLAVRCIKD